MCVFRKTLFAISTASLLFLAQVNVGVASTVYKWTDESGRVHFGQRPPQGVKSEQVNTSTPRSFGQHYDDQPETVTESAPVAAPAQSTEAPENTDNTADADGEKTAAPAVIQKDAALCAKAQESKHMLTTVPIIRRNGKVMTVEEKNEELKYVEELIFVNC